MNGQPSSNGRDTFLVIGLHEIESGDIGLALKLLNVLLTNRDFVTANCGKIHLAIHGYDNDPRPLWSVPDVRKYVAKLDSAFPYWFHFASLKDATLSLIALSLCPYVATDATHSGIRPDYLQAFLASHFPPMNALYQRFGISLEENKTRTIEIAAYLTEQH